MKKIFLLISVLSVLGMVFMNNVFANELNANSSSSKNDIAKMIEESINYKNQLEATGGDVQSVECKLSSSEGDEYVVKAYATSEPVLLSESNNVNSLAFAESDTQIKNYKQTYVVDINDSTVQAVVTPSQTDVFWSANGAVQAYSTVYYSTRSYGGNVCYRVDRVELGWSIVDANTQLADRRCKAYTAGPGFNTSGIQDMIVQETPIYSLGSNSYAFNTNFQCYVDPDYTDSIGSYQTCYVKRGTSPWWYFEFANKVRA